MRTDSEGVELHLRTAFGRAQIPALLLFCVVALVGLGVAIGAMQMEDRASIRPRTETLEMEVTRSKLRDEVRLGPEHEAIVNRGRGWYEACRAHQLLSTPDDPFAGTSALPFSSHLPMPDLIDHVMAGGLPSIDACSSTTSVPTALWEAGQEGDVANPFYPQGVPITPEAMSEARARLQPLLEREWGGLQRGWFASEGGLTEPGTLTLEVPYVVPEVTAVQAAGSLELALASAATSVFALLLLFVLAMVPDRVRLAFGLRGVGLGRREVSAQDVEGVALEGGRVVVTLKSGSVLRSPRLDEPQQVEPFIDQYQRLSSPVHVPDSPELQALRGQRAASGNRSSIG